MAVPLFETIVDLLLREPLLGRFVLLTFLGITTILMGPATTGPDRLHVLQRLSPLGSLYEIVQRLTLAFNVMSSQQQEEPEPARQKNWIQFTLLALSLVGFCCLLPSASSVPWTISFAAIYVVNSVCLYFGPTWDGRSSSSQAVASISSLDILIGMSYVTAAHILVCFMTLSSYSGHHYVIITGGTLVNCAAFLFLRGLELGRLLWRPSLPELIMRNVLGHQFWVCTAFLADSVVHSVDQAILRIANFDLAAATLLLNLAGSEAHTHAALFAICAWTIGFLCFALELAE